MEMEMEMEKCTLSTHSEALAADCLWHRCTVILASVLYLYLQFDKFDARLTVHRFTDSLFTVIRLQFTATWVDRQVLT